MDVVHCRDGFGKPQGDSGGGINEENDPSLDDIIHSMGKHLLNCNDRTGLTYQNSGLTNRGSCGNGLVAQNGVLVDSYIGSDDQDTEDEVSRLMSNSARNSIDAQHEYPRLTTPFYDQLRQKYPNAFKRSDSSQGVPPRPLSSMGHAQHGRHTPVHKLSRPASVVNVLSGGSTVVHDKVCREQRPPSRTEQLLSKLKNFNSSKSPFINDLLNRPSSRIGNRRVSVDETKSHMKPSPGSASVLIDEYCNKPRLGIRSMTATDDDGDWSKQSHLSSNTSSIGSRSVSINKSISERRLSNGHSPQMNGCSDRLQLDNRTMWSDTPKRDSKSLKERLRQNQLNFRLLLEDDTAPVQLKRPPSGGGKMNGPNATISELRKKFSSGSRLTTSTPLVRNDHRDSLANNHRLTSSRVKSPESLDSAVDLDAHSSAIDFGVSEFMDSLDDQSHQYARDSDVDSGIAPTKTSPRVTNASAPPSGSVVEASKFNSESPSTRGHQHPKNGPMKADHNIQLILSPTNQERSCDETSSVKSSLKTSKSRRSSSPNRVRFKDDMDDTDPRTTSDTEAKKSSVLDLKYARPLLNGRLTPPINGCQTPLLDVTVGSQVNHQRSRSIEQEFFDKFRSQSPAIKAVKSKTPVSAKTSPVVDQLDATREVSNLKENSPPVSNTYCENEELKPKSVVVFNKHKNKGRYSPSKVEDDHRQSMEFKASQKKVSKTRIPVRTESPTKDDKHNPVGSKLSPSDGGSRTSSCDNSPRGTGGRSSASPTGSRIPKLNPNRTVVKPSKKTIHIPASTECDISNVASHKRSESGGKLSKSSPRAQSRDGSLVSFPSHDHGLSESQSREAIDRRTMSIPFRQRPCSVPADYLYASLAPPDDFAGVTKETTPSKERTNSLDPTPSFEESVSPSQQPHNSSSMTNLESSKELSASRSSLKEKVDNLKQSAKNKFSSLKRAISLDRIDNKKKSSSGIPKLAKSPSLRSLKLSFRKKDDRSQRYAPDGFLHSGTKDRKLRRSPSAGSNTSLTSVNDVEPPRNARAIGRLVTLNSDGTQVVELVKPPHGPFGFYIARGNAQFNHGIFISRLSDGHPEKFFAGLLGLGDEILEVNGTLTHNMTLDEIYDCMAATNKLVLKTLPLLARSDMV